MRHDRYQSPPRRELPCEPWLTGYTVIPKDTRISNSNKAALDTVAEQIHTYFKASIKLLDAPLLQDTYLPGCPLNLQSHPPDMNRHASDIK